MIYYAIEDAQLKEMDRELQGLTFAQARPNGSLVIFITINIVIINISITIIIIIDIIITIIIIGASAGPITLFLLLVLVLLLLLLLVVVVVNGAGAITTIVATIAKVALMMVEKSVWMISFTGIVYAALMPS